MPEARPIQTNWTGGEFSPRLFGRIDLQRYPNGASYMLNVLVQPQGGFIRRPGSYFVGAVKDEAARVRLVPFIASDLAAYVLEFGNGYVRFYRNRALLTAAGVPIEIATPYATADLRSLRFAQSADVLYICHASYQPRKLSRTGAATFGLSVVQFDDGPYQTENTGAPGFNPPGSVSSGASDGSSSGSAGGSNNPNQPYDPGGVNEFPGGGGGDGGGDGGGGGGE